VYKEYYWLCHQQRFFLLDISVRISDYISYTPWLRNDTHNCFAEYTTSTARINNKNGLKTLFWCRHNFSQHRKKIIKYHVNIFIGTKTSGPCVRFSAIQLMVHGSQCTGKICCNSLRTYKCCSCIILRTHEEFTNFCTTVHKANKGHSCCHNWHGYLSKKNPEDKIKTGRITFIVSIFRQLTYFIEQRSSWEAQVLN
jgi:hypothetical protein